MPWSQLVFIVFSLALLRGASAFLLRQPPLRAGIQHRRLLSVAAEHGAPSLPVDGAVGSKTPQVKGAESQPGGEAGGVLTNWGQPSSEEVCLRASLFANDKRAVVLFDGMCHFCSQSVNIFMALDGGDPIRGSFRYAALQGDVGQELLKSFGMDASHFNTVVLVEPDCFSVKSEAILRIARQLKHPLPEMAAVASLLPLEFKDGVYDFISAHRHIFGERDSCRIPEDHEVERFLD